MSSTTEPGETRSSEAPVIPFFEPIGVAGAREGGERPKRNRFRRALDVLGPGFITGASDDDPSGIGAYTVTGASLGFTTLWLALLTFPLMASIQFICAKVGMVSGMGLSGVLRRHYPRWLLYGAVGALVIANTINAGADIGAIAAGINLLAPVPVGLMIAPIAVLILILQIWGSYRLIASVFKWLALALVAYIGCAFFTHPNVREVARGTFVPHLSTDHVFLMTLVAMLGTTISPYLFFWQSDQEVEEEISLGRTSLRQREGATGAELKYAGWDVGIGMFFSNLVMYFIIFTTAATLHAHGQTNIQSATDAAKALEPIAGAAAKALLAIGLIGTGFLAVPILTGAGAYGLAEALGWSYGLDQKPNRAKPFYSVIAISTLVGIVINYVGINPITALYWTAVLNGLMTPPLLILIMLVANNARVMGTRTNGRPLNLMGWATTLVMSAAALALVATWAHVL